MKADSLPPAFALLENEPNTAADDALLEALPFLSPSHRAAALDILIRRAHVPSLARIVGRYHEFDDATRASVSKCAGELATGLRAAILTPEPQDQSNAVELIADGRESRTAYLLVEALRSRHASTRQRAGEVLHDMADRALAPGTASKQIAQVGEALAEAVGAWESHEQPKILEAAIRLGGRTESAIRRKLEGRRSTIGRTLRQMLATSTDPRSAGFVLRALAIPPLRPGAVRAITGTHDVRFLTAIFDECWLLADPQIALGCHWVRIGPWCQRVLDILADLDARLVAGAVRLLLAAGGQAAQKERLITELIGLRCENVLRAVVWQLARDTGKTSTRMLTLIASRPGGGVAGMASREVGRRRRRGREMGAAAPDSALGATAQNTFEACWDALDVLCRENASQISETLRAQFPEITSLIRERLISGQSFDRARALRLASATGLVSELGDGVRDLAHDPDPLVRGAAVGMLDRLAGPIAHRLVRLAVSDPDDRVQANAIEVLDRLDAADRLSLTRPKLASRDGRLRANAIKSLLRLDVPTAGESLLEMLEHGSVAHRISALWVVERLRLRAAAGRIEQLVREDPSSRVRRRARHVSVALLSPSGEAILQAHPTPVEPAALTAGGHS